MTEQIGGLSVDLTLDAAQYQAELKKATAALQKSAQEMNSGFGIMKSGFDSVMGPIGLLKGAIAGFAANELVQMTRAAINSAAAVQSMATNLGLTADHTQELIYAGAKLGLTQQDLNDDLQVFSRRLGEARAGSGEMVTQLKDQNRALLENIRTAPGLNAALDIAVEALAKVKDRSERAALAFDLFGQKGAELAKLANQGADGLGKLRNQAHDVGAVLEGDLLEQSKQFNKELEEIARRSDIARQSLLTRLAPALLVAAQGYASFLEGVNAAMFGSKEGIVEFGELGGEMGRVATQTKEATRVTKDANKEAAVTVQRLKVELEARQKIADAQGKEIEKTELLIGKTDDLRDVRIAAANKDDYAKSEDARVQRMEELNAALQEGTLSWGAYRAEMEKARAGQEKLTDDAYDWAKTMHEVGLTMGDAFADAIVDGRSLDDILKGLEKDLIRMAIRAAVLRGLDSMFGTGPISNVGPTGQSYANDLAGGYIPLAGGGNFSAGQPILVGEKGPEMLIPNMPGGVIPNHELGMGGMTVYLDARGADVGAVARMEAGLRALNASVEQRAWASTVDYRQRGGK